MSQFAVFGLGAFGQRMVEELMRSGNEVIVVDRDTAMLDDFQNQATVCYGIDVVKEDVVRQKIPASIDAAIVDLGNKSEASILLTSYLKKMGVAQIIVKAESDEMAEVLSMVGATRVVFPGRDIAISLTAQLLSPSLLRFMAIGGGLVIAQMIIPERFVGLRLIDSNIRSEYNVNILAWKEERGDDFTIITPEHVFSKDEVILALLEEERISDFSQQLERDSSPGVLRNLFQLFFKAE